ncbi:hypothetical protein V8F20_002958 [Naviculisporaceae sp. PSN 640]
MEHPRKPGKNKAGNLKKRQSESSLHSRGSNSRLRTTEPPDRSLLSAPVPSVTAAMGNLTMTAAAAPMARSNPPAGMPQRTDRPPVPPIPEQYASGYPPVPAPPQQHPSFSQRMATFASSRSASSGSSVPAPASTGDRQTRIAAKDTGTLPAASSTAGRQNDVFNETVPGLFEVSRDHIYDAICEIAKFGKVASKGVRSKIEDRPMKALVDLIKNIDLEETARIAYRPVDWSGRSGPQQSFEPVLSFRLDDPRKLALGLTSPGKMRRVVIFGCCVGIFKSSTNTMGGRLELCVQFWDETHSRYPGLESIMGWDIKLLKYYRGSKDHCRLTPLLNALFGVKFTERVEVSKYIKQTGDGDLTTFFPPQLPTWNGITEMDCRHYMSEWVLRLNSSTLVALVSNIPWIRCPNDIDTEKMKKEFNDLNPLGAILTFGSALLFRPRLLIYENGAYQYVCTRTSHLPEGVFSEVPQASSTISQSGSKRGQVPQPLAPAPNMEKARSSGAQIQGQSGTLEAQNWGQQLRAKGSQVYETPMVPPVAYQSRQPQSVPGIDIAQRPQPLYGGGHGSAQVLPNPTLSNPIKDVYNQSRVMFTEREQLEIQNAIAKADHDVKQHTAKGRPLPKFTSEETAHLNYFYQKMQAEVAKNQESTGTAPSLTGVNPPGQSTYSQYQDWTNASWYGEQGAGMTPARNLNLVDPASYGGQGTGTTSVTQSLGSYNPTSSYGAQGYGTTMLHQSQGGGRGMSNVPRYKSGGFNTSADYGSTYSDPSLWTGQNTVLGPGRGIVSQSGYLGQHEYTAGQSRHAGDVAPPLYDDPNVYSTDFIDEEPAE